jgi:hypothetical protein
MHVERNRTVSSSTSMKIVSKLRGYYDSLRSLDRDDAHVRNHDTLEVRYTFAHLDDDLDAYHRRQRHHFERTRARTVADDAFRFFDAPVMAMTDELVVVNPRLSELHFASQVDPFTAWQDLSMFLGNNLVKNVSTPKPVTDDLKAHAHGFDKQSFRKSKTGRKKLDRSEW